MHTLSLRCFPPEVNSRSDFQLKENNKISKWKSDWGPKPICKRKSLLHKSKTIWSISIGLCYLQLLWIWLFLNTKMFTIAMRNKTKSVFFDKSKAKWLDSSELLRFNHWDKLLVGSRRLYSTNSNLYTTIILRNTSSSSSFFKFYCRLIFFVIALTISITCFSWWWMSLSQIICKFD